MNIQAILDQIPDSGAFVGIIAFTFVLERFTRRGFSRALRLSAIEITGDPTTYKFLGHVLSGLIYTVGFIIAGRELQILRSVASSLLAGAGIAAVAIGFASQHALSNIISGFFIILFKPYRIGDRLNIRNQYFGTVEDITLRHSVLRDLENRRIVIPNSLMSNEIILNLDYHDSTICRYIEVHVAYETDLSYAKSVMADEIGKHPKYLDTRTDAQKEAGAPLVLIRVQQLGDYSITLRGYAWVKDFNDGQAIYSDLLENIKKRFELAQIVIPMPPVMAKPTHANT
jgi:small conductance mechanosensitive channel